MRFEIIGEIVSVETIARGPGIADRKLLVKAHGPGRWRKMKGIALIRLANGQVRRAELHWYEAHGVGRRGLKIKRYFDLP